MGRRGGRTGPTGPTGPPATEGTPRIRSNTQDAPPSGTITGTDSGNTSGAEGRPRDPPAPTAQTPESAVPDFAAPSSRVLQSRAVPPVETGCVGAVACGTRATRPAPRTRPPPRGRRSGRSAGAGRPSSATGCGPPVGDPQPPPGAARRPATEARHAARHGRPPPRRSAPFPPGRAGRAGCGVERVQRSASR